MSFNDHQQYRVNLLLGTDFKKQYDLIPNEFKNNYWFEYFLWHLADIYRKKTIAEEIERKMGIDEDSNWIKSFDVSEAEGNMNTTVECTTKGTDCVDKNSMSMTLGKDGTLQFSWIFAFVNEKLDKKYSSDRDDILYELAMKLSEDKKTVLVEHTTASNRKKPWKCYMGSIFDTHINEICRVAEAIDVETGAMLYHEEFIPVGTVDPEHLREWHQQAESEPIQLLGIAGGNVDVRLTKHHQSIRQVFVGKCTIGENTRYAICWKPDCFVDKSYQESFQSIVEFAAPGLNLSHQLDLNEQPWLIEISEEDFNGLIGVASKKETPQFRKLLK